MTEAGRVLFVTGRLAEPSLRKVLDEAPPPFSWDLAVMKITVAALMTTEWIGRFLKVPEGTSRVMIPGLCEGDTALLSDRFGVPVEKGPEDLRELPMRWGQARASSYGSYDVEIVAEINNAPRLDPAVLRSEAEALSSSGADVIDIGCTPGLPFPGLGAIVSELVDAGFRVSIDTFDPVEIRTAVQAGASLVLSVNASNLDVLDDIAGTSARAVAVPDMDGHLATLEPTLAALERRDIRYLIDPVIEPIGLGFMSSLERYATIRRRYPDAEMLMGVGNITEMTEADSTGINAVLMAICQELGVRTVLTTEVASWTQGAVRELDVARRLMHYAMTERTIPKGIDSRLLTSRDPRMLTYSEDELRALQVTISDPNFRIFADRDAITVLNRDIFVRGRSVQDIFAQLGTLDASHAFYLGGELARAQLAMQLGKTYRQDRPLTWGYLTHTDETKRRVTLTGSSRRDSQ